MKSQSAFAELVYYYIYGYVMMICLQTAIAFCISYITVKIHQNASNTLVFNKSFVYCWSDYSVDVTSLSIFMQLNVTTRYWALDIYALQGWLNTIFMEDTKSKTI